MSQSNPMQPYLLADTRFGRMYTLRGDTVISRSLRIYGEFAGDEVDSILSLVRPGDHVVDVGANLGFHSLALAGRVGPGGRVIAIEPQRFCFQLLCANLTLNQLTTVEPLRAAVGASVGTCAIPRHDPATRRNAGATAVLEGNTIEGATDQVPMITLDGLDLTRCDFIKIDTEGHEVLVLEGARQTITKHRPTMYVEIHDAEKLRLVARLLKPFGYGLILHHTYFFRATNPMAEPMSFFGPSAAGSAIIALPPGRSLPEDLPGTTQVIAQAPAR